MISRRLTGLNDTGRWDRLDRNRQTTPLPSSKSQSDNVLSGMAFERKRVESALDLPALFDPGAVRSDETGGAEWSTQRSPGAGWGGSEA